MSVRILLLNAASNPDWKIQASDVTRAFLQSSQIQRDVYIKPPKEAQVPNGKVWKLKRTVYGLADASRGFYLNYGDNLVKHGMEICSTDPAFFIYFDDKSKKSSMIRNPTGMVALHVDDSLTAGGKSFNKNVQAPMTEKFEYGSHSLPPFKYIGLNVDKSVNGIKLDQDHYIKNLAPTSIDRFKTMLADEKLCEEGQSIFRSEVGKLNMLAVTSRPDLAMDSKILSSKFNRATKKDLNDALKKLKRVKETSTKMVFPNMGKLEDWMFLNYSDGSLKSMPNKITSTGGQTLILVNVKTGKATVLDWKSKQLKRIVHSSLGAEALALLESFGELAHVRMKFVQLYGTRAEKIPAISIIDSKNLWESIHNIKPIEDKLLLGTIAELKECVAFDRLVQEIRLLPKEFMLADGLTKVGGSSEGLLDVLRNGVLQLPGGFKLNHRTRDFSNTWCALNRMTERERRILFSSD